MTVIEASSGTYRSRVDGTIVLSVEIEPRHASAALALFGMPGTPMALAALKAGTYLEQPSNIQNYPEKDISKPKGGELCLWAVLRCKDDDFFQWIQPVYRKYIGDVGPDDFDTQELFCRHAVMVLTGCEESRSELDHCAIKADQLHNLIRKPFAAWMQGRPA